MENYILGIAGLAAAINASATENGIEQNKKATPDQPNIVFILADDMGYGDLSCFGSRHVKTPNIDRLSETGTTFTQCYAGSGISSPSRCALMTGRNTGNTTIRDNMCPVGGIAGYKVSTSGDSTIVRRANLLPSDTTIADVVKKPDTAPASSTNGILTDMTRRPAPTTEGLTNSTDGLSAQSTPTPPIIIHITAFTATA